MKRGLLACVLLLLVFEAWAQASTYYAPVIIPAHKLPLLHNTRIAKIRVFRTTKQGGAEAIPFQIDERDKYSDYILDKGHLPNSAASNGLFDNEDELSFMGKDMGPVQAPRRWPGPKPDRVVEIKHSLGKDQGAVYVGIFERAAPAPSTTSYVTFSLDKAEIVTGKYSYRFNNRNYMVVRGVDINQTKNPYPLIDSSTFFARIDLKYLLSVSVNHQSVKSSLEAYKVGPVRAIVRVNFDYSLLSLNLDLGMYTEVSFFANSVLLPAIIENPLNSKKILNPGSLFYYGFSLVDNPQSLALKANLPAFKGGKAPFADIGPSEQSKDGRYWISAEHQRFMFFLEMISSPEMREDINIPAYYTENIAGKDLAARTSKAAPLGKSPVNVALVLNLANLREGVHKMSLRLFIENQSDPSVMQSFTEIDKWQMSEKLLSAR